MSYSTRAVAFVMATMVVTVLTAFSNSAAADRPNIVLMMADDLGYECMGANGSATYKTPVFDRLSKEGMRFTHCHSQPICTPSRVQIMTGRYNDRNYIRFGLLDPKAKTFAHMLKSAGYATCVVGKWQLAGGFDAPKQFGFDEYCLWQLTRRPSRYANPGLEVNGKEVDYKDGGYGPDIVSDYALDFITRNKDKSFFVYYPMILPHWSFEPTPDSKDWDPKFPGRGGVGSKSDYKYFADMVTYTDKIIGKIVDHLKKHDLDKNTLVIFTGDNGTYKGITSKMIDGSKVAGGKGKTLDTGTHVPMLAYWPGKIPAGRVCDDLIDFTDILPTLADVSGSTPPAGVELDGRSFAPQLRGSTPRGPIPERWRI